MKTLIATLVALAVAFPHSAQAETMPLFLKWPYVYAQKARIRPAPKTTSAAAEGVVVPDTQSKANEVRSKAKKSRNRFKWKRRRDEQ